MDKSEFHFHTAGEEWLAAYSAGVLSEAKSLLLECQIALQPHLAAQLAQIDCIGGEFLESAKGEPLSADFSARLSDAIARAENNAHSAGVGEADAARGAEGWAPKPLTAFLTRSEISLKWKKSGPGVSRALLSEVNGERLYLLKSRPGMVMPVHSHKGQEWTLVLQGGYHVGQSAYARGDLHCEDESCKHQPVIDDDGEECISLVADEGRLVFSDPVLRLIQPFLGI
ncbi:cupin domain-containing protein [Hyphococcus sp.]|jgi:putative transcriptional regulator|uniref:cupin domain-containing protein n=1 Tax=Hyphococcus sp. TaxID=2038636 RepID=UPI003D1132F8